jgi:uncharacterized protein YndB with AHSA1/START domain
MTSTAIRTVSHDTFVIDRTYPASPQRVFTAFSDVAAKARWWGDPNDQDTPQEIDFRVGGRETTIGTAPDGSVTFGYCALYQDIVQDERIVYTYDMTLDGRRISVSVATLEFLPIPDGTRLIVTEQGVYLDGLDTVQARREGTDSLMSQLDTYLQTSA